MISHTDTYKNVAITFFEKEVEIKDKNGKSCFRVLDFFTFKQPRLLNRIERFAYASDRVKYADIWKAYENKKKGTSLAELFDKKTVDFLKRNEIENIESLAEMKAEDAMSIAQSGMEWRKQAIQFLKEKEHNQVNNKSDQKIAKTMQAILDILPKATKDLLPEEVKRTIGELS